jgi:ubiquinone/menaquinone biosynthesis C-methylase UbiE
MGLSDLFANNLFVKLLRGDTSQYDLIASMVGTRLGDRVLVIGGKDGRLVAAVGKGTGLTGRTCAVESDQAAAAAVETEATGQGVLVEVHTSPLQQLPYDAASFDVVVVPAVDASLDPPLNDVARVLRPGGRCVVVAKGKGPASDRPVDALKAVGFRASRLIAQRGGFAFYEAIKSGAGRS